MGWAVGDLLGGMSASSQFKGRSQIMKEILLSLLCPISSPALSYPGSLSLLCRRTLQKLERVMTADVHEILVTAGF